ncbi:protoporphyrinogen oxidase [Alkalicoccobacillus murimartini]|uniref:Coproporphyrinogen III oxidase n=1 Tax=Alkalicoccobacillus murimartini TaxID=171685 RepID=A0ABT9YDR4_9BACI|nr:protoporphyrinogen oxidase [Alkalicoccobacillus murimartini]MDQ0205332.1 oxygen-dependent protoporphyrinogen oxidase [Alkalicoccobacillus murimartini]
MKKKVAIIGGGITGLAAAFEFEKSNQRGESTIDYQVIEASSRLGGKIRTFRKDGFIIEAGPDSYLKRKESMTQLIQEVGLADDLTTNDTGQSYILKGTSLYPIPAGAVMGVPTEFTPFATTGLFSPLGKIRALGDFFIPASIKPDEDISLGHFFRRRLGNEVVDHLIEPLLSGIYGGDMDKLSLKATFPHFQQMEETHRSLIKGIKHSRPKPQKQHGKPVKKEGMFQTLKGGLESLVEAVADQLHPQSVRLNEDVKEITKVEGKFILQFANSTEEAFDDVIVTTPPPITAQILGQYDYFDYFKKMEMTSVATVAMAFPKEAVKQTEEGTGFVVSRKSGYTITACTWTSKKWRHTTPDDKVILRCYVGRPGHTDIVKRSDEDIIKTVLSDLSNVIEIKGEPDFYYVSRWSNPQYQVGHTFKLEKMREEIATHLPGLHLAGAGLEGVGLPDCINQGKAAAEAVLKT